jgi:hypothetical protein
MLIRQAPVVKTVVGIDSARGSLPKGAEEPLVEPPVSALVDVRITESEGRTTLSWRPHSRAQSQLPSATGTRAHTSRGDAYADAEYLFGLTDRDWVFAGDGRPPIVDEVRALRDAVLIAHEVDLSMPFEKMAIVTPQLVQFTIPDAEQQDLWIVLDGGNDEYLVYFDHLTGNYGLGSRGKNPPIHVGVYGSLWETIESR